MPHDEATFQQPADPPLPSSSHPPPASPVSVSSVSTSASHPNASPQLSPTAAPFCPATTARRASPPLSPTAPSFHPSSPPLSPSAPLSPPAPLSPSAPSFCSQLSAPSATSNVPLGKVPKPTKKQTVDELRAILTRLGMNSKGTKESLYKRLMKAYCEQHDEEERSANAALHAERAAALAESGALRGIDQPHTWYLCFDVEATCMAGKGQFDYPNEIIEFPVVLMGWTHEWEEGHDGRRLSSNARIVHIDTFHSYVRPTWRPQLSNFCTNLTGIHQSTVDKSETFPEVLLRLESWMRRWGLLENDELKNAMDFVPKQLHITPTYPPRYPKYFLGRYLNIKEAVRTVRAEEERRQNLHHPNPSRITTGRRTRPRPGAQPPLTIVDQLTALGLSEFEGRQHSGIDDASNISRILQAIGARGVHIEPNGVLSTAKARRYAWMGNSGEVLWNKPADPINVEGSLAQLKLDDDGSVGSAGARRALTAICATS
ncbi:uncharacterized protein CcaverHIS019_0502570 [Cutaneotrichosporon cavernicola]|uniref:SAP domain-containing protein n=1 Tax=Cutaneotrichosporon cavernicola TaxID=279322 RepID=A0AA48L611_9TREE|nr:uncharacterized protein CcaverHIS019_0502570 [Cutaneotrichosporon cavernicola]BEI92629.1 hypothetical protein CcaverHIS019_0502570 [Cutaneotrichosporon cavernicola]